MSGNIEEGTGQRLKSVVNDGTCAKACLIFFLVGSFCLEAVAGNHEADHSQKIAQAHRIKLNAPQVDGVLDDQVWKRAEFVSGLKQKDPNEGQPAMHTTEVAFVYDASALYVGARLNYPNPEEIHAFVTRRDNAGNSERLVVSLDPYHDQRTAYSFAVTAAGVRVDYFHSSDSEHNRDYRFDPVWEAKSSIGEDGWTAEMKIPFSQLRFNKKEKQVWGININRWIPNTNEDLYWVLVPKDETGWASRFGDLVGIEGIRPSRRIELLPYQTSSATFSDVNPDNPFTDGSELSSRVGLDFKMGLGPNLTLEGTVNPDFSQVEADPAVVNLTAFETFFPERRPFFTEGSQLFDNIGPTFFYSRRIGAPPHGRANGDFMDVPDNTTILSAAKLSGRLQSGLSIGALTAVTAREHASSYDQVTDSTTSVEVEPLTAFGATRVQQEFGASQSTIGFMFTGMRRDLSSGEPLAARLNRQAYAGNSDWNLRFQGGKYEISGYMGFSYVEGDSAAITRVQRSSARYFQRPDATHVSLDSSRTSLFGYAGSINFEKNSGEHWLWDVGFSAESPNFEINDTGILFSTDEIGAWGELEYRETQPGNLFREYALEVATFNEWNFEGVRQFSILDVFLNFTFKNFWRSTLHFHYRPDALSSELTRGGPLMGTASDWHVFAELGNNRASKVNWGIFASYINDDLDGWDFDADAEFSFKPADQWELSLSPGYSRERNTRQYFDEKTNGREITFGQRYIFSAIDRSTFSSQIRLNYAITPDLSLEVYAEPFAASGRRFDFGELLAPRSRQLRLYGSDGTTVTENEDGSRTVTDDEASFDLRNGDFNVRSFRSNVVLRWEWRRGSTLFLVWQQDRFSSERRGDLVSPGDLFNGLSADGDNFLALKVSYWLPIR
ncbi:carbohydrate binding family 9 domain-containing protein [candidate division KSB1 bacterium]|nr:carbohydrate binding family 9 domain-containing protein [candidate division KSB1 bacterium]NIR73035.1 carbohydrate binding family 9 domain-containing protein [candidate division KSB1 bacterium]NIS23815.1 carbohydrate binding family 9 domain-containing protein [candidate division KSB1 bacterium]NIT70742.1 carbohydrate binding family 9 domain-containing protein [candidate division KSB1 bacterium]NIU24464.1 carbohydrate binding family 9 domain-containing protein [candidate division KSB1 bacteri